MSQGKPNLLIGWTTVAKLEEATKLANDIVSRRLAACVQVDGPIRSHYRWQDRLEQAEEFRLTLKFLEEQETELANYLLANHPYDAPEWVVIRAESVGEKYLSWAEANSSTPPL